MREQQPFGRRYYRTHITGENPVEEAVIVPGTTGGKLIPHAQLHRRVDEVRRWLSEHFGGYTSTQHIGGWVGSEGKLIKEPGERVVSFASQKEWTAHKKELGRQLVKWRRQWKQEAVGYEYEGDLYFIGNNKPLHRRRRKVVRRQPKRKISWGMTY